MKRNYHTMKTTLLFKFIYLFCLAFILTNAHAQVATNYVFSQSTGTYTPISGGTVLATATDVTTSNVSSLDQGVFTASIPFSFTFNGTAYTSVDVYANGFISFGGTTGGVSVSLPLSSTTTTAYNGAVAAMARDLWGLYGTAGTRTSGSNTITGVSSFTGIAVGKILRGTGIVTGTTVTAFNTVAGTITMSANASSSSSTWNAWPTGEIRAEAIGTTPNRTFVIQYSGFSDFATGTPANGELNFQIQLNEGGGVTSNQTINIVYGPHANLSTTSRTQQVGLRGATNADFNNRTSTTDWNSTSAGTINTNTVTRTNLIFPAPGLTYTWNPITPCTDPPTPGISTSSTGASLICPSATATLNVSGNTFGTGQTYQWQSSSTLTGTYSNISSVQTVSNFNVNPTTSTYYQCAVTCGATTAYSTPVLVSVNPGFPAGSYTIDAATATGGTNFQTFAAAVSAMNCGIQGPVVFNIAAGTYNERVTLTQIAGASAINTVSFIGAGKALTTLANTGTGTGDMASILLNGADHIIFRDMTISSPALTYGVGIYLYSAADSNTFVNMDIVMNSASSATTTGGIVLSGSLTTLASSGNPGSYNVFDSMTVTGAYYGITFYGTSSSNFIKGNRVSHSTFTNQYYYGIKSYYHGGFQFDHNTVKAMRGATEYGIQTYYGSNYTINANTVNTVNNPGIYSYYTNAYLYNNTIETKIYNNMVTSGADYGLYFTNSDNVKIYHNTVVSSGTGATATVYFISSDAIDCRNNIFVNTGSGNVMNTPSTVTFTNLDYNNYYTLGATMVYVSASVSYADLAAWKAAVPALNINSVSANPHFVSGTNLHLHPLDADLKGVNIGITVDIDDVLRSDPPSLGADEKAILNNSVTLQEITPGIICAGPNNMEIRVINIGKNIINTLTVDWELDGVPQTSIPYSTPIDTFGGSGSQEVLIPLGSVMYTANTITTVKAWISSPNGSTDPLLDDDTLTLAKKPGLSGPYTIAASGADFATITEAVFNLNNYGICDPVSFSIAAGTYSEKIILNPITGASATNTIVFEGVDKISTILTNTATSAADMITVLLNGADHVTFRNMTIASTHLTYGVGIMLTNAADSNTLANLNITMNTSSTATTTAGIALTASLLALTDAGNTGNYNRFDSLNITGAYYGITFYGGSSSSYIKGNSVNRSTFSSQNSSAIRSYYHDGLAFYKNTISGLRATTNYGIYNYYASNYRIEENNIISKVGIQSGYSNKFGYINTIQTRIANNMIMAGADNGMYFTSSDSVQIYHNSVTSSGVAAIATIQFATVNGIDCRNNQFVNLSSAVGNVINIPATSTFAFLDYNNYYTFGTSLVYVSASISYPTLTAWKAGSPSYNVHGFSKDPLFTNLTDLHLQPAGPLFFGTPVGVTTDIDGDPRSATLPTAGSDEKPVPPINAGIVELVSPTGVICSGNYDIKVKLRNKGQAIINSVDIEWELNGLTQPTINIVAPLDTSGSIAGPDSIIDLGNHFLAANSVTQLRVWTANPDGSVDPVTGDDTLTTSIGVALSGDLIVGGATPDYPTISSAVAAVNNYGVCGPVTFKLAADTFAERVIIGQVPGVSAINTLSFIGAGKDSTMITNTGTGTSDMITVLLSGADHITFRDMTIAAPALTYGVGILLTNAADSNRLINMNIMMNNASTAATTAGIAVSGSLTSATGTGNNGNYNLFDSLSVTGAYYGITFYGLGSTTGYIKGNTVSHSTFTSQYEYPLRSYYQGEYNFSYNTINTPRYATTHYGIYNYYVSDYNINGNTISVSGGNEGIYNYYANNYFHNPAIKTVVSNNIVIAATGSALSFSNSDSVHVLHNTAISSGLTSTATAYFTSCDGIDCRNNILVNTNTGAGNAIYTPSTVTFTQLDYNNYYTSGTGLVYTTTTVGTLAAWQTAVPAFNIHSITRDPQFVSATNLHLQYRTPLSIINGVNAGITTDIDGDLRASTPSIGADEGIVPSNSAGILCIASSGSLSGSPGYPDQDSE
jgi:hypothetical protein